MASHPVGELYAHRDVSVLTGSHGHDSCRRIDSCINSRDIWRRAESEMVVDV